MGIIEVDNSLIPLGSAPKPIEPWDDSMGFSFTGIKTGTERKTLAGCPTKLSDSKPSPMTAKMASDGANAAPPASKYP